MVSCTASKCDSRMRWSCPSCSGEESELHGVNVIGYVELMQDLQLDNPSEDDLPSYQNARFESGQVRDAVQDVAAGSAQGKCWEGTGRGYFHCR